VLIIGIDQSIEREGLDRVSIALPGQQQALISAVATAAKGPVVVVVMGGGSLDLSLPKESADVQGMLWVGYPGQAGGQAIADVIFGAFAPGNASSVQSTVRVFWLRFNRAVGVSVVDRYLCIVVSWGCSRPHALLCVHSGLCEPSVHV
jgi:hypothetical protein